MYQRRVTRTPRSVERDHFVDGFISAAQHQIHRRFAVFVRKRKAVAGGLRFHFLRGGAGVDEILRHAAIDQQNFLSRDAFAIEGLRRAAADGRRRPRA